MQHFVDLQENSELGESNSWLSVKEQSGAAPNTNLDRVLFNDLVEIVPLVQSLIVIPLTLFTLLSSIFIATQKKGDLFYLCARGKGNKTATWVQCNLDSTVLALCVDKHTERKASDL